MKKKKNLNIKKRIIKTDPFGNILILKRMLIGVLGIATYGRFNLVNKLKIEGREHLKNLPKKNVMFISNHQTYYADVMALYHVFCSVKWKLKNINFPIYMLIPRVNTYYIAAEETMKDSGLIPKIFALTGAITVKRSWRSKGEAVSRGSDLRSPDKIKKALQQGWVINFPQGTTTPYAPIRKGTANAILKFQPIVVPIVIDGFRRAFDKKGLFLKKRGTTLKICFKSPMNYSPDESIESITEKITKNIEQNPTNIHSPNNF